MTEKKQHWEKVFETKNPDEVSWTESYPTTSMALINNLNIDKTLPIIDIGGGESFLAEELMKEGFKDISVLDISEKALERAQKRLGKKANEIQWIVCDVLDFKPQKEYALWHDRASFHFLTESKDIRSYTQLVNNYVNKHFVLGTFSTTGPFKCSGLNITQYDCASHARCFDEKFEVVKCKKTIHKTPFGTEQNFVFTSFKKRTR